MNIIRNSTVTVFLTAALTACGDLGSNNNSIALDPDEILASAEAALAQTEQLPEGIVAAAETTLTEAERFLGFY